MIANYVCPSLKHYPLEFRRFVPRARLANSDEFHSHTDLCLELVDWVITHRIPGDFTVDSYFTNAETLNHIQTRNSNNASARRGKTPNSLRRNCCRNCKGAVADGMLPNHRQLSEFEKVTGSIRHNEL